MQPTFLIVLLGSLAFVAADFRSDALSATNVYRRNHGANPLTQDAEVSFSVFF